MNPSDDALLAVAKDLYLQLNLNHMKPEEVRDAGRRKASRNEVAAADAESFARFTLQLRQVLKEQDEQ